MQTAQRTLSRLTPTTIPAFTALCASVTTTLLQLANHRHLGPALYAEATRLGLIANGPLQWRYNGATGDDTQPFGLDVLLPIQQAGDSATEYAYVDLPEFRCVTHTHTGPWSELPALYDDLFRAFSAAGYTEGNTVREVYHTIDSMHPERCVTTIQISIA